MSQSTKKKKSPNRHMARESAIEALYAWHNGGNDAAMIPSILADRLQQEDKKGQDEDYLREIVYGVSGSHEVLDELIGQAVNGRSLRSIAHVELNVLRIAVWELKNRLEIPYKVIINEALELTRAYADEPSRGFINGVLDKVAQQLRAEEMKK
ncbi:MAG: transcription antitermination factor NusB [Zetaproteobacteria bacterium]|nr:MAG: transcription antitermination factor NusB [Zetaproteobacteria bacterium]